VGCVSGSPRRRKCGDRSHSLNDAEEVFDVDPTLVVAFEGLMLFQTGKSKKKKHVTIVKALHHEPKLFIFSQFPPDRDGAQQIHLNEGDVVSFEGVHPGPVTHTVLYDDHVPKLRKYVVRGEVHPYVVNQKAKTGVVAYVALPPGQLTTFGGFAESVLLTNKNGRRPNKCFARFVVLETMITTPVYLIVTDKNGSHSTKEKIDPTNDLILVSNISINHQHPHFPEYHHLLTDDGVLGPIKILDDHTCDIDAGVGYQFRQPIEDALEALRRPVPNGDCGPTGP
jgi:hypothetical protein